jgi:hypothetical protein
MISIKTLSWRRRYMLYLLRNRLWQWFLRAVRQPSIHCPQHHIASFGVLRCRRSKGAVPVRWVPGRALNRKPVDESTEVVADQLEAWGAVIRAESANATPGAHLGQILGGLYWSEWLRAISLGSQVVAWAALPRTHTSQVLKTYLVEETCLRTKTN